MTGEEKICDKAAGGFVISIDASSEIKKLLVAGGVAVSSSVSPALQCCNVVSYAGCRNSAASR